MDDTFISFPLLFVDGTIKKWMKSFFFGISDQGSKIEQVQSTNF